MLPKRERAPVAGRARLQRQPLVGGNPGQPDLPVQDHAVIELGDGTTAGTNEQKRQHTVHETGNSGEYHAYTEIERPEEVLGVTLTD